MNNQHTGRNNESIVSAETLHKNVPFSEEIAHLALIGQMLAEALREAESGVKRKEPGLAL